MNMDSREDYETAHEQQKLARETAETLLELRSRELEKANETLTNAYEKMRDQQAQLVQQEKLASIGLLAAGIAHEINNPIGFVKSNLHVLSDYFDLLHTLLIPFQAAAYRVNTDPDGTDYRKELTGLVRLAQENDLAFIIQDSLDSIKESLTGTERVQDIVVNLRDYTRSDSDKRVLCNINEIIDSTLKVLWSEIKYKITIAKEYGELPELYAYAGQLNQVFINIIMNAVQAMPADETLKIVTRQEGDSIRIDFIDHGHGIAEQNLSKLFDPFFTTKDVGQGTGLGLYISYGIMQKHLGTIAARNNEDKGATFTITLPIDIRNKARA